MDEEKSYARVRSPPRPPSQLVPPCNSADTEMSEDGNRTAYPRHPSGSLSPKPSRLLPLRACSGAQFYTSEIDEERVIVPAPRSCHMLGVCSSAQVYEGLEMPTAVLHSPSEEEHGGNRSGTFIRGLPISASATVADSRAEEVTLSKDYLYSCKFCLTVAKKPVLNLICGHLFCWNCVCTNSSVRHCPYCESHFDATTENITIIPVYSERYPGDQYPTPSEESSHDELKEPNLSGEGKNLTNETTTEGVVIPPYPRYSEMCEYESLTMFIASRLGWVNILRDVSNLSYYNENCDLNVDLVKKIVKRAEATVVKELLSALKWLTGEECPARRVVCHEFRDTEKVEEHLGCGNSVTVREKADFDENVEQPFRKADAASYTAESISMFSCRCCSSVAYEPVVTFCGHLFCWSCLYRKHRARRECPVCETRIDTETLWYYVCPINGTLTLPEEVAELLTAKETCMGSQNGNDGESLVPNFLNPHRAIGFLQYTIDEVHKVEAELKKKIDNLCERWTILDTEAIDIISIELEAIVINLYEQLMNEWRTIADEKKPSRTLMLDPKGPLQSEGICDATDAVTSYQSEDRNVKRLKRRA